MVQWQARLRAEVRSFSDFRILIPRSKFIFRKIMGCNWVYEKNAEV